MGIFSLYTGLIYNDWFGLSFNIFHSAYTFTGSTSTKSSTWTYLLGVDVAWYGTSNNLDYYNSLKMKLSVIFAIAQMMFGLYIAALNHIYFRGWIEIVFEVIPEILLLGSTFGYMVIIIIVKWCIPGADVNILQTMTDFFLSPNPTKISEQLYTGQAPLQFVLLIIAIIQIPILFFAKPTLEIIIHKIKHRGKGHKKVKSKKEKPSKKNKKAAEEAAHAHVQASPSSAASPASAAASSSSSNAIELNQSPSSALSPASVSSAQQLVENKEAEGHHEDENNEEDEEALPPLSELYLKQAIHTIEFTLATVSNTASYLRLWALSLAHSGSFYFFSLIDIYIYSLPSTSRQLAAYKNIYILTLYYRVS